MHEKPLNNNESQPSAQEILLVGADFIEHFGITVDPIKQPKEFLEALKQLNPRFEGDKNLLRFELELAQDSHEWPKETQQIIMEAAERMRMLETDTPLLGHYDAVIALGGARMANLDRTLYAAQSTQDGQTSIDLIIVAGSARKVQEGERSATNTYAPKAVTEFDLCDAAAVTVQQSYPNIEIRSYGAGDETAGTPKVIAIVLRDLQSKGILSETTRLGVVTTQIYQAATSLDARRVAKEFGITDIMTAGNPSDPKIIEARTPATYKSEIIRTLQAAALATQAA